MKYLGIQALSHSIIVNFDQKNNDVIITSKILIG